MEDELRGYVGGPLGQGKRRGRGEDWLAAQLVRRGHSPVQQYPVWKHTADQNYGRYFLDVAMGRVAIELYAYWQAPWESEYVIGRTTDILRDGWSVLYVWLRQNQNPQEAVVNETIKFAIDAEARSKHTFRTIGHDGTLLRVGWLDNYDQVTSCRPDAEPKQLDPDWSPEPPAPPSEVPDDEQHYRMRARGGGEPPKSRSLEENNEIRRQWHEYHEAFDHWESERERRRQTWEILPKVDRSSAYRGRGTTSTRFSSGF